MLNYIGFFLEVAILSSIKYNRKYFIYYFFFERHAVSRTQQSKKLRHDWPQFMSRASWNCVAKTKCELRNHLSQKLCNPSGPGYFQLLA